MKVHSDLRCVWNEARRYGIRYSVLPLGLTGQTKAHEKSLSRRHAVTEGGRMTVMREKTSDQTEQGTVVGEETVEVGGDLQKGWGEAGKGGGGLCMRTSMQTRDTRV